MYAWVNKSFSVLPDTEVIQENATVRAKNEGSVLTAVCAFFHS